MSQTNARLSGGGIILPQGSAPAGVNAGEQALILDSDGTAKLQDAAGTKTPVGSGGFGADTTVSLPNASAGLVPALELIASLTSSVVGSEASQWLIKVLTAGAQVSAMQIGPAQTLVNTSLGFIGHANYSINYDGSAFLGLSFIAAGTELVKISSFGNGIFIVPANGTLFFGTGQSEYIQRSGLGITFIANSVEKFRVSSAGVGFFASAGTTKQTITGSKGANAALASLLTALAAHGLLTDSTT